MGVLGMLQLSPGILWLPLPCCYFFSLLEPAPCAHWSAVCNAQLHILSIIYLEHQIWQKALSLQKRWTDWPMVFHVEGTIHVPQRIIQTRMAAECPWHWQAQLWRNNTLLALV